MKKDYLVVLKNYENERFEFLLKDKDFSDLLLEIDVFSTIQGGLKYLSIKEIKK